MTLPPFAGPTQPLSSTATGTACLPRVSGEQVHPDLDALVEQVEVQVFVGGVRVVRRQTESDHREAYQSIAPAVENGLYLVPKVID